MHERTTDHGAFRRRIGLRLTPESLAPRVQIALETLGYDLVEDDPVDTADTRAAPARIWLVDADRLAELPSPARRPDLRILLLNSASQPESLDARILARTVRPGRLATVYAMIQRALEETPRRVPRVPTRLSVRCIRPHRRSFGVLLSISEGGCLLRTHETLPRGTRLDLQFALPDFGLIRASSECRYASGRDRGVAFDPPTPDLRHRIAHYVSARLADGPLDARLDAASSRLSA